MGITAVDIIDLNKIVSKHKPKSVLELGSQYLYDTAEHCNSAVAGTPVYGKAWFVNAGIEHVSVDLNGQADFNFDITDNDHDKTYDLVTDYGTIEHTGSAYLSFKNCHNWTNTDGLMIHENPKTGNWPLHGNWFFTKKFYEELAKACKYEIISLTEVAAMGNTVDGWNVYCVLKKTSNSLFNISEKDFYNGIYGE